jgi:hypothetical protein
VFHNGLAWSASVYKSNNVQLIGNSFVGAQAIGVHLDFVRNVTMDNNFIGDVLEREWNVLDKAADKEACVAVCSYMTDGSSCFEMQITGNVAAGCKFAGFIAPGHDCGDTTSMVFKDNVSHSNKGTGANVYPNQFAASHSTCYEMSHFAAYKTQLPCLATHYSTSEMRARDITCIDSEKGINLQTGREADELTISLSNSKIYGETEADDCPENHDCRCNDKFGFMLFTNNAGSKDLHITSLSARPIYKIKTDGAWGGEVLVNNVEFHNFNTAGLTKCERR